MKDDEIVIRYIKMKNKVRKIVSYKYDNCYLKVYHKKINNFLTKNFSNSIFSNAYIKKKSIYTNAKAHIYNDYFIMLDIKSFFQNISHQKLAKRMFIEINKKIRILLHY